MIRRAAEPHGLTLVAATPVARYDAAVKEISRASALDPRARSIVVIGNGGGAFWTALKSHAARDLAAPIRAAGARCTTVYPFMSGGRTLSFIELGKVAGIAGPSILGVTVHPVYGPWIAFRAALLLEEQLDSPGDALGFDPCPRCIPRTCIPACPVGAVSIESGWDIPKCLTHRVEVEPDCTPRCHARAGCVVGPEHRYPDDELAYHQMRALRSMRPYYEAHIKPKLTPS